MINADATDNGNGGHVVIWSDGQTTAHRHVQRHGRTERRQWRPDRDLGRDAQLQRHHGQRVGRKGTAGTWLIDPTDLIIDATACRRDRRHAERLAAPTSPFDLGQRRADSPRSRRRYQHLGNGDIDVNSAISWNTGAALTLKAYNNVNVNASISLNNGTLALNAANGAVAINANITVAGAGGVAITANPIPGVSTSGLTFALGSSINYGPTDNGGTFSLNGNSYMLVYTMADARR